MANKKFLAGILAMALAFGMTVIGCGDGNGGVVTPTGGNAGIPGTQDGRLSFADQEVWTFNQQTFQWARFLESRAEIYCWRFGGTGAITGGLLSFTLTPDDIEDAWLEPIEDRFNWLIEEGATISVEGVQSGTLELGGSGFYLYREYGNVTPAGNGYNITFESVIFVYVDSAVTISHPGGTFNEIDEWGGFTHVFNDTVIPFNVNLQQGWNALRVHRTGTIRFTDTTITSNITETVHVGNPANLRWVIDEWGWGDRSAEAFSAELEGRSFDRHGGLRRAILRGR